MKKNLIVSILLTALLFSGFVIAQAKPAQNPANGSEYDIPEQDGTYDVPGQPALKVRVFVHKVKPDKPGKPTPPAPTRECNLLDPDSEAVVDPAGWKLPATFTYNLNPSGVPILIDPADWPEIAQNSFNVWEKEIANKVTVERGEDTAIARKALDGKNLVAWGLASGSALGVTYIWYYPDTGKIVELDTIMNKKFVWTWSEGVSTCAWTNFYDAQAILTHEIGHWFGLDDHYTADYVNNTMYGYGYKGDAKADTLTTGDIQGAQAIY